MNKFITGAAGAALFSLAGFASAGLDMDHTHAQGANLTGMPGFGVNQRFEAANVAFNGATVDDFVSSGTTITQVEAAFETSIAGGQTGITNWHLSIWSSVAAAAASTNNLVGDVVNVDLGVPGGGYTSLAGTGAVGAAFLVDFSGLNIGGLTSGTQYWMGLFPDLAFTPNGQTFILACTVPAVLGAGTNNNDWGINPGNGFGLGTSVQGTNNAALLINTRAVPEPATMAVLGLGVVALLRRRRK